MTGEYRVEPFGGPVDIDVRVPGSKSITNRALLLAALSDGDCILRGCGFSEDSRVFIGALQSLGFDVQTGETVVIRGGSGRLPNEKAEVYVGSAGTAARFLTALMGLSDGIYEVTSSEQMKARPMRPLMEALETLGARFAFSEKSYAFPFTVEGAGHGGAVREESPEVPLNIDASSQFLSALLLCAPMVLGGFSVRLTGTREAMSYVRITERMMRDFGYTGLQGDGREVPVRISPGASYSARDYTIEPDVSAACYFYAMAAANGGRARVRGVTRENSQGDMRFLDVLERMGCTIGTASDGDILVSRNPEQPLHGLEIDMSDFSDQTMTLAAIAPFADGPTTIRGVGHIRRQESDRIRGLVTELTRLNVTCEEYEDGLTVYPFDEGHERTDPVLVRTYEDHRMAMALAVTGTRMPGVIIDDPSCCRKTFETYFDILSELTGRKNTCDKQ